MTLSNKKIDPIRYRRLVSRAMPAVIETEEENARILALIETLMEKGEDLTSEEERLLNLLSKLAEDFETRFYNPREGTPIEILRHLMEARGITQSQLWDVFGSKGVASEVLSGKRGISKSHARALAAYFHVPVDLFV